MGEVSELLHEILVNGSTDLTRGVANMAGVSRSSVEKQCYANVNPSVAVIKAAWLVTKDPRLKKLLEPINPETGEAWELTPKINGKIPLKPIESEGVDVFISLSLFLDDLRLSLEDGEISNNEHLTNLANLNRIRVELEELSAAYTRKLDDEL